MSGFPSGDQIMEMERKRERAELDTFLRISPYFQMLLEDTKAELAALFSRRSFQDGNIIANTTELTSHVLFFLSGTAKASSLTSDGREVFHGLIGPGQVQGVVSALDNLPNMHQIQAVMVVDALAIELGDFRKLTETRKDFQEGINEFLADRFRYFATYKTRSAIFSSYEKVAQCIADLASGWYKVADGQPRDSVVYVTQQELSLMLGLSRQSVNKSLKRLEQEGLIEVGYSSIKIRDYFNLIKTAE